MKNKIYLQAAKYLSNLKQCPTNRSDLGMCSVIRMYIKGTHEDAKLLTDYFKPSDEERRKYKTSYMFWVASYKLSFQENRDFRILCLLLMDQII